MSIRKLYASVATTTAGAASIEFIRAGRIQAISWVVVPTSGFGAGTIYQVGELSRASASQTTTNDTLDVLDICGIGGVETTSGAFVGVQKQTLCDIQVRAGDRLYVHVLASGTGTARWDIILTIKD